MFRYHSQILRTNSRVECKKAHLSQSGCRRVENMSSVEKKGLHPIIPELLSRLQPAFIDVYNQFMINIPLTNRVPIVDIRRNVTTFKRFPGGRGSIPVAEIREIAIPSTDSKSLRAKIYIPNRTEANANSPLPIFVFYTHGGFVVCGLDVDDSLCTRMAEGAQCIVVTAEYAKAPENPFPEAIHDSWEALQWVYENAKQFNGDSSRIAVGGIDAGANIAAVLTHMVNEKNIPGLALKFQCLFVPILDATATVGDPRYPSWTEFQIAPCLPAEKQLWNRAQYLGPSPSNELLTDWRVSPIFAKQWQNIPPALVGVAEIDLVRDEGLEYASRLKQEGIAVETIVTPGVGHPMCNMDEAIDDCKKLVEASIVAVRKALHSS